MATLTATEIADFQTPSSVRLSPDGTRVVYVLRPSSKSRRDLQTSLWVADVGMEFSARQITSGNFYDSSPRFSPDGASIAFLSDRDARGKSATLYCMPASGPGEALPLTRTQNEKPIADFQWCPSGQRIAYLSADEKSDDVKEREKEGYDANVYRQDIEYARLRIVDIRSREIKTLVSQDTHVGACAWSPTGDRLAFTMCKRPGPDHTRTAGDLCIIQLRDGAIHKICFMDTGFVSLTWAKDQLLWITAQDGRSMWTSKALWSAGTDSNSEVARIGYGETDSAMEMKLCGTAAVIHIQRGLSDRLEQLPDQKCVIQLQRDISSGWDVAFNDAQPVVAYMRGSLVGGEVVSSVGNEVVQLSQHEARKPDTILQDYELLSCTANDGTLLDGVYYRPASHEPGDPPPPGIVMPHGGPYWRSSVGIDSCWNWTPWLLAQGYAVLHPNYRGGSGRGAKFAETVRYNAAASYQDVITLTEHCIKDAKIDPSRVAIVGWSQGGFLAYLAVTRSSTFHFAAAVAGAGPSCWDTMTMTSDIPVMESALGGGLPWFVGPDTTTARKSSPLWHMHDIRTPLLILHGEEDVRVPVSQARSFAYGMEAHRKSYEMILYPREPHGSIPQVWERAHTIHMLEAVKEFLSKHLKP